MTDSVTRASILIADFGGAGGFGGFGGVRRL